MDKISQISWPKCEVHYTCCTRLSIWGALEVCNCYSDQIDFAKPCLYRSKIEVIGNTFSLVLPWAASFSAASQRSPTVLRTAREESAGGTENRVMGKRKYSILRDWGPEMDTLDDTLTAISQGCCFYEKSVLVLFVVCVSPTVKENTPGPHRPHQPQGSTTFLSFRLAVDRWKTGLI